MDNKEYRRLYQLKNKEKKKQYQIEYEKNNKERIKKYHKERYDNLNPELKKETYSKYNKNKSKECIKKCNQTQIKKGYRKEWHKINYNNNLHYKLSYLIRARFNVIVKNKFKNNLYIELIGCSISNLKQHLESQFLPEMSWDNHGVIWEIDHIKACASFDLTDIEQQKECFYYTNLQPLFKTTEIAESLGYKNYIGNRNKNKF
jgi:hypothetical protein